MAASCFVVGVPAVGARLSFMQSFRGPFCIFVVGLVNSAATCRPSPFGASIKLEHGVRHGEIRHEIGFDSYDHPAGDFFPDPVLLHQAGGGCS